MQNDLISKSEVLKLLDELGYINCTNPQDYQYNCRIDKIRQGIIEMPIMYDIDKVIDEIQKSSTDETLQKTQTENYTLYR